MSDSKEVDSSMVVNLENDIGLSLVLSRMELVCGLKRWLWNIHASYKHKIDFTSLVALLQHQIY